VTSILEFTTANIHMYMYIQIQHCKLKTTTKKILSTAI